MSNRGKYRAKVLHWMERRDWHLRYPRIYCFWEWVIMPREWGGRYGFRNWVRWSFRRDK